MKMKLFILIASILFCLPDSSLALRWLSTPGEMLACTGDDVTFHWEYDTQDERVSLILIINAEIETTFLTYYIDDGNSKASDEYRGRTEFIEYSQEETKVILKSVTKNDSVGYFIELGGIGEKNLANLKVFNRRELTPTLRVNNKLHEFDQTLNVTSEEILTVTLSTAQCVPANITISVDGRIAETCTRTTACVHSLSDNNVEDIGFEVDYGVCGVITEQLTIVSDVETIPLIPSKVENSESRMTERSEEMTTFVTGHGEKFKHATAVVPVILTFAVIILIVLLIRILYILWYRPKCIKDTLPNGPIESKLFEIFSIFDKNRCCCKKRDKTPVKFDRTHDNNKHENASLLSDERITITHGPADMTLIDERGSGTRLISAVYFAPQDNLSNTNPVPLPTTLPSSLPTPTPEPSTSTSPAAPSRTPSYEPTTAISIRKDDGPRSSIDTEYISPHDKPVRVSKERKNKMRRKNKPQTKKNKNVRRARSRERKNIQKEIEGERDRERQWNCAGVRESESEKES